MEKRKKPHSWYNRHLYYLVNLGFQHRQAKDYKALVRESKLLCRASGRGAGDPRNLS
jgi:hypothetical protein